MKVLENLSLSEIAYYHIGGRARYVLKIVDRNDIFLAIEFLHDHKIEQYLILGLGSNVIIGDRDFDGAVLWLCGDGQGFEVIDEHKIQAFAGETVDSLIQFSFQHSLTGLEWAGGLPSAVGGAVRGNAGCFGSEIKDTVVEVEVVDVDDPQLAVKTISAEELAFSYRESYLKKHPNLLIISATFKLTYGGIDALEKAREAYQANITYRQTNHPMEYPSCGSVFKNIVEVEKVEKILAIWPDLRERSETKWHKKISMGYVINRLGFSGRKVGGAMVSPKHTNYIVNIDQAKAEDVKALISEIQEKFTEMFGFTPEPEVIIL